MHGDLHLGQLVGDESSLSLIDLDRVGIGHATLRERYPRLIIAARAPSSASRSSAARTRASVRGGSRRPTGTRTP